MDSRFILPQEANTVFDISERNSSDVPPTTKNPELILRNYSNDRKRLLERGAEQEATYYKVDLYTIQPHRMISISVPSEYVKGGSIHIIEASFVANRGTSGCVKKIFDCIGVSELPRINPLDFGPSHDTES